MDQCMTWCHDARFNRVVVGSALFLKVDTNFNNAAEETLMDKSQKSRINCIFTLDEKPFPACSAQSGRMIWVAYEFDERTWWLTILNNGITLLGAVFAR
jgi:hypothetical protein